MFCRNWYVYGSGFYSEYIETSDYSSIAVMYMRNLEMLICSHSNYYRYNKNHEDYTH